MNRVVYSVAIDTDGDPAEMGRLFVQYVTEPEHPFQTDYGDNDERAKDGWPGPFVRAVECELVSIHVDPEPDERTQALVSFVAANGYFAGTYLPDGRVAFLIPLLLDQCDIGIGAEPTHMAGISERYSYRTAPEAIAAWATWIVNDLQGEPTGWVRHRPTDRRRWPDGDASTERIAP